MTWVTGVLPFYQWKSQRPRDLLGLCVGELGLESLALNRGQLLGRCPLADRLPSTGEAGLALLSLCLSVCHGSLVGSPDRATTAFATGRVSL